MRTYGYVEELQLIELHTMHYIYLEKQMNSPSVIFPGSFPW